MSVQNIAMNDRLRVSDFERFHAKDVVPVQHCPSLRELVLTALITLAITPFSFVIFLVVPVMGMITVSFSFLLSCLYLFYRRSILVACTAIGFSVVFWVALFLSIQGIKNNLEVLLFFLTATGIPVSAIYCMFIGSRIWTIRGGAE
jgi:hypothetical protein